MNKLIEHKFKRLIHYALKDVVTYKELYKNVEDFSNIKNLPFIDKITLLNMFGGDLIDLHSHESEQGVFTRVTSGTSNMMGMFMHSEREIEHSAERFKDNFSWYLNKTKNEEDKIVKDRVCIIHNFSLTYVFVRHMMKAECIVSAGNPYDLNYTVEHILRTNSNIIRTSPTLALKLAPLLKEANHEMDVWLLAGSGLSDLVKTKLKENSLGDPKVLIQYGMAETLNSTYQCEHLEGNKFHLFEDDFIYEFLDEEDEEVDDEKPGELVITRLSTDNPIIRYKTGDLFIKHKKKCSCGKSVYSCIGRSEEFIKINGVVLFKDKIDKAIDSIKNKITGDYQLEFKEIEEDGFIKSKLNLRVKPLVVTQEECESISKIFQDNFEISENYYWSQGIEDGFFAPIKVLVNEFKDINKTKEIVDSRWIGK